MTTYIQFKPGPQFKPIIQTDDDIYDKKVGIVMHAKKTQLFLFSTINQLREFAYPGNDNTSEYMSSKIATCLDLQSWSEHGVLQLQHLPDVNVDTVTTARKLIDLLSSMKHINDVFLAKARTNTVAVGDTLVVGHHETDNKIVLVTIIDGAECPTCGVVLNRDDLSTHMIGWACTIASSKKSAEDAGLVQIMPSIHGPTGYEDMLAAREALPADTRLVPRHLDVWAPGWVVDAINTYHSGGTTYAGLPLTEFLQKMNPEQK